MIDDSFILLLLFAAVGYLCYALGKIHGRLELMDEIENNTPDGGGGESAHVPWNEATQATDLVDQRQPAKLRIVR